MALVWIEGFETHTNASQMARKYASTSGGIAVAAGRVFGTSGVPVSSICVTPSAGADNTFVLGFGMYFTGHNAAVNAGAQGWYCERGSSEQFHVEMESTSGSGVRLLIKRGTTTVATSSYFSFGVWHYFEFKATVRTGVDGAYELRHNGALDISGSGVDLAASASDGWDVFAWRFASNLTGTLRMDDMYVLNGASANNNDFLGPSVVEGLMPNANGASSTWTQNGSGANYTSVDDAGTSAPVDTGVGGNIGSDTNGQKDLFDMEDLTQIKGTIHGVQLGVQMAMSSTGTRTVKTKYRDPDTTEADGTSHVVDATIFDEFTEVMDLNPASGLAWDITDIDGGQFGVEVVS